jgi:hypothetical protein
MMIAGVAAMPIAAAPMPALAGAGDGDDAELIALGAKLDRVEQDWLRMTKADITAPDTHPRIDDHAADGSSYAEYEDRARPLIVAILSLNATTAAAFPFRYARPCCISLRAWTSSTMSLLKRSWRRRLTSPA